MAGELIIAKRAEGKHRVVVRTTEEGTGIQFRLEFVARAFENAGFEATEWPPKSLDGRFRIDGYAGPPGDALDAEGLTEVMLSLTETGGKLVPYFSVYYRDETAEPPTEEALVSGVTEVTVAKKNRGWQFALGFGGGGGTVTGATTKSLWKSALATLISAGAGYGIGSQFEYWSVE